MIYSIDHLIFNFFTAGHNAKIIYTIVAGDPDNQFGINELGVLSARKPLDYETNSSYVLTVEIEDEGSKKKF